MSLAKVKQYLDNNRYHEALGELAKIDRSSLNPEDEALYCVFNAKARLNLSDHQVGEYLDFALGFYRRNPDTPQFASAKYLYGWMLSAAGDLFEARETIMEAYIIYKRQGNNVEQARLLNRLGFICFHLGENESAIKYIEKCIKIYQDINDIESRFTVSVNLGQLYAYTGRLADSINIYRKIDPNTTSWRDKRNIAVHYIQSALPNALIGNLEFSFKMLGKAKAFLESLPREQAIYYENLGWIHLLEEDYKSAETDLRKALSLKSDSKPASRSLFAA